MAQARQRILPVAGFFDAPIVALEKLGQELADGGIGIDQEQGA
jgi:hypothetical protein